MRRYFTIMLALMVAANTASGQLQPQQNSKHPIHQLELQHAMRQNPPGGKLLIMSDIHFNPFCDPGIVNTLVQTDYTGWQSLFESSGDTSFGNYGADTYYRLFKSGLQAMQSRNGHPDMIIINGDFLCHDFGTTFSLQTGIQSQDSINSFIRKTTSFVCMMLRQYFPNAPVLPVLGNNDDYCGDYRIQRAGPFLSFFATQFQPMLHLMQSRNFTTTFSKGGYYMATMPWDSTQVFIGLNSIFFSPKYANACNPTDTVDAGWEQFAWLRSTLTTCAAQGKKVWLSFHIPPGIDVYSSNNMGGPCESNAVGMWKEAYNDSFIALVNQFSSTITTSMAGHTHMDDFRLLGTGNMVTSFIHITPAVSPIFGNNPSFQEITWDTHRMQFLNSVTYQFNGIGSPGKSNWEPEYDYAKTYGVTAIDATNLTSVWKRIGEDATVRNEYLKYYYVNHPGTTPSPWKAYWCGIRYLTLMGFPKCNCK